WHTFEYGDGI
nr:Chain B, Peptide from Serine acetyltransferase [Salmonella enterica subsp. enterica serovar Typhimurium str. LT2]